MKKIYRWLVHIVYVISLFTCTNGFTFETQVRIWIFNIICHGPLCVQWLEV